MRVGQAGQEGELLMGQEGARRPVALDDPEMARSSAGRLISLILKPEVGPSAALPPIRAPQDIRQSPRALNADL